MAWLNAVPKKPEPKKGLQHLAEPEAVSRLKAMMEEGAEVPLPPISTPWLVDILMEVGPVEATGMGAAPLSWSEMEAWQRQSGRRLLPWESSLVRKLSTEFLAESQRAEKPDCPAPWVSEFQANRDLVAAKLAAAFGARAKTKGKP